MAMEFWGAEIKAGEPLKVEKEEGTLLHLSQASLGEVKKGSGNESVVLSVTIGGKKIVLGTLSSDKFPQIAYDLVFEKDFELSHNGKHGSVHVCGYKAEADDESEDGFGSESEEEEDDIPTPLAENGKAETKVDKPKAPVDKAKATKPDSAAAKQKVKAAKPVTEDSDEEDSDEEDSDEEDSDEEMLGDEDDSSEEDDEEESSEEEDEATPKNAKQNKKRPSESATKTPVPEKKAKLVTPQKSGGEGKKGTAHTATPHPSKAGKGDKGKQQTPKSGGSVKCQACSKTFNSDGALQSHTKAKHSEVK